MRQPAITISLAILASAGAARAGGPTPGEPAPAPAQPAPTEPPTAAPPTAAPPTAAPPTAAPPATESPAAAPPTPAPPSGASPTAAPPTTAAPPVDVTDALQAHRLDGNVRIDGQLDEPAWSAAPAAGRFTQEAPRYGEPVTSPTEVRVLYDDQYIYVGARMHLGPGGRVKPLVHRRDRDSASDWFGVAIDSVHDHRTAYEFRVNAAGVQRDVLLYSDSNTDDSWDALWDSGVTVDDAGWTAELRIPLSLLRIRGGGGEQTWGINFVRISQVPEETARWHVIARSENAFVSRFPLLVGLSGLRPQGRREIIPYITSSAKVATSQDFDDRGLDARAGIDAHLGLGSSSLLDLTFLPDFGQTEVDQVILNLSTVETFFPEKRTFFLEGSELFQVNGPQLFYTRRIGRSAPSVALGPDEAVLERPLALDILGAAKFTGKYEGGLNVGVLLAETEPAYARVRAADGSAVTRQLAPTADSGVVRVLQQLGTNGSHVGAFSSFYGERGDAGRHAYVGAFDGTWKSSDSSVQLDGLGSLSAINDDDGVGSYGQANAVKRWNAGWYVSGKTIFASRHYNPNDLGYIDRSDQQSLRAETGRQWDRTLGVFRNWSFYGSGLYARDQAGRTINKNLDGRISTGFTNSWSAYIGGGNSLPLYDDRELRTFLDPDKKYLHRGNEPYVTTGVATARSGVWYGVLDLTLGQYPGGPSYSASLSQTLHPSSRFELELITDYLETRGELHWLETQDTTPVVGLRRLRQLSQVVRTSYAFTPGLTLQAYMQLFLAAWNYRDLKSYVDDDTLAPGAMAETTAFSEHDWNLNAVLRWEIRRGSTLYAVYTHGAYDGQVFHTDATLSRRAIPALLRAPSDDVLQVKLTWLFR